MATNEFAIVKGREMSMRVGNLGMVTPVGLSAPAACAAMRAGISRLQELPVINVLRQPVIGAYVPTFAPAGETRLVRLLTPAVRECIALLDRKELASIPLLVGVSEPDRPDWPRDLEKHLIGRVSRRLRVRFHPEHSRVISEGRASVLSALGEARRLMKSGAATRCIVSGVDSLIHSDCRGWLYRNQRLKLIENPDGLHPGEAAAALEITLAGREKYDALRASAEPDQEPEVHIVGLGFGDEKSTVLSGEPNLADGLVRAVKDALAEARLDLGELDFRLSDVNGEQYYFRETINTMIRILRVHKEGFPIWHCADSIGDVGAAAGAVLLAMATAALRGGYAPGTKAICQTSSDYGRRAASVIRAA
jgi:3-oxoacyl-[acyl-carrier-protein] synthase-1